MLDSPLTYFLSCFVTFLLAWYVSKIERFERKLAAAICAPILLLVIFFIVILPIYDAVVNQNRYGSDGIFAWMTIMVMVLSVYVVPLSVALTFLFSWGRKRYYLSK